MKKTLLDLKHDESGAVLIIVALLMVSFMVFLALVLDIGSAYLKAGQLQKVADAAVYSAGRMLPVAQEDTVAVNAIKDSAINYAQLNGFSGLTRNDVVLGNIIQGSYTDIKVTSTMNVQTNFARVIGINSINISRSAKSKLSPTSKTTGAVPLGILKSQLDESIINNNVTHIILKYGKGGSTQGFFGALDLDGTKAGGASDYRLWFKQGFPGEIAIDDVLYEENGNMVTPTYEGYQARYNGCTHFGALTGGPGCTVAQYVPSCPRVAKVVVYTANGSNAVKVTGFAAFILEAQTNDGFITGSFVKTLTAGQGSGGSAGESADYGLYNLMLSE